LSWSELYFHRDLAGSWHECRHRNKIVVKIGRLHVREETRERVIKRKSGFQGSCNFENYKTVTGKTQGCHVGRLAHILFRRPAKISICPEIPATSCSYYAEITNSHEQYVIVFLSNPIYFKI
jgi:hypothetical protein